MRTEAGLMILPLGWRFPQQFATREICCDSQFVPPELPDHPNGHCCWNHIILVKRAGGPELELGQQIWEQNDQATRDCTALPIQGWCEDEDEDRQKPPDLPASSHAWAHAALQSAEMR
jgi:hypothetical protein